MNSDLTSADGRTLSRRGFLSGAIAGVAALGFGRLIEPAGALAAAPVSSAESYVALRDAVSPLDTARRATATAEFESWWVGRDAPTRKWVRDIFEALDRGEQGSFARASRRERAALLDAWRHPDRDPLSDSEARRHLDAGLSAFEIARAPQGVPDERIPVG